MCGPAMGGKYFTEALSHKKRNGGRGRGGYLEFYSGPFAIIKQQMCRAPVFIQKKPCKPLVHPEQILRNHRKRI